MPTKIMPLGASNTYGMYENPNSPGGYRGPLQDMLRGENLSFDFVGLDSDGRIADPQHNGYSGKPIDWFTRPVNEPIYDRDGSYSHTVNSGSQTAVQFFISRAGMTSNDVILLNAGTNDVRLGDTADKMLADMDVLLNQIVTSSASPQVQVMTLAPVGSDRWADGDPSRTNNETIEAFNEGLERLVADKYGALGVTLVDPALTTADLSSDGVHMDADGYEKMAEALFESLMDEDQVDPLPSTPGTPPPTSPPPSGGTGPDTITVRVSGDAYKGDPNFALLVNGRVVDATNLVTADRSEGEWDTLVFKGDFNLDGTDRVGIQFTNDLYTRGVGDRNLYVDSVTVNGQTNGRDHTFTRAETQSWDFPAGSTPPPSGGSSTDTITVRVSGDAYRGDPNFALTINGRVVDSTNLVTADRSEGEWDTLVFKGDFNLDGTDRVGIQFTNDLYTRGVGDRNLYVDSVTVNGQTNGRDHTFTRAGTEFWDV